MDWQSTQIRLFLLACSLGLIACGIAALWIGKVPTQWGSTAGRESIIYWINTLALLVLGILNFFVALFWA